MEAKYKKNRKGSEEDVKGLIAACHRDTVPHC